MASEKKPASSIPKLSLSREECAVALGVGIRKIDELIAGRRGNRFPVVYLGTKPVFPVRELSDWLAGQCQHKGGTA